MMKRAEAAKCFISGLMDFRNASNGVTLAHCLATYGQVLALETVIENDPNIVNLVDDSGLGSKDSRPDRFGLGRPKLGPSALVHNGTFSNRSFKIFLFARSYQRADDH